MNENIEENVRKQVNTDIRKSTRNKRLPKHLETMRLDVGFRPRIRNKFNAGLVSRNSNLRRTTKFY